MQYDEDIMNQLKELERLRAAAWCPCPVLCGIINALWGVIRKLKTAYIEVYAVFFRAMLRINSPASNLRLVGNRAKASLPDFGSFAGFNQAF